MRLLTALLLGLIGHAFAQPAPITALVPDSNWIHRDLASVKVDEQVVLPAQTLNKATVIWERSFIKNGSRYVRVNLDQLVIPAGSDFDLEFVSDPIGTVVARYPASSLVGRSSLTSGLLPAGRLRIRVLAKALSAPASFHLASFGWQAESTVARPKTAVPRFDPVATLNPDHPIRMVAESVAMLHIGPESISCTGVLVAADTIATNYHCIARSLKFLLTENLPHIDCDDVIAEFDYLAADAIGTPAACAGVIRADRPRDLAILKVTVPPNKAGKARQPLAIGSSKPDPDSLWVVHHPVGLPMVYERNCRERGRTDSDLLHDCQTNAGSSGAPILSLDNKIVALHYFGPYNPTWTVEQVEHDIQLNGPKYNRAKQAALLNP